MARVTVAPALARWMKSSSTGEPRSWTLAGDDVRELLEALFQLQPELRGYVVDERGALRHHVVIFVDGTAVADKQLLRTPVPTDSDVYIFQALSGG